MAGTASSKRGSRPSNVRQDFCGLFLLRCLCNLTRRPDIYVYQKSVFDTFIFMMKWDSCVLVLLIEATLTSGKIYDKEELVPTAAALGIRNVETDIQHTHTHIPAYSSKENFVKL